MHQVIAKAEEVERKILPSSLPSHFTIIIYHHHYHLLLSLPFIIIISIHNTIYHYHFHSQYHLSLSFTIIISIYHYQYILPIHHTFSIDYTPVRNIIQQARPITSSASAPLGSRLRVGCRAGVPLLVGIPGRKCTAVLLLQAGK